MNETELSCRNIKMRLETACVLVNKAIDAINNRKEIKRAI
jgi:hypothetical protein